IRSLVMQVFLPYPMPHVFHRQQDWNTILATTCSCTPWGRMWLALSALPWLPVSCLASSIDNVKNRLGNGSGTIVACHCRHDVAISGDDRCGSYPHLSCHCQKL